MATIIHLISTLLPALLLTIVIESIPLCFFRPRKQWLKVGLLCNALTNPLLNCIRILIYSLYPNATILLIITVCLEIIVVSSEAWFYQNLVPVYRVKALWVSLLCNGLSYTLGVILL